MDKFNYSEFPPSIILLGHLYDGACLFDENVAFFGCPAKLAVQSSLVKEHLHEMLLTMLAFHKLPILKHWR